jgi:hypothetical protein
MTNLIIVLELKQTKVSKIQDLKSFLISWLQMVQDFKSFLRFWLQMVWDLKAF